MGPSGFVAVIAGWTVAEVGRQPWVIWGQMRTAAGVSPVSPHEVSASLLAFLVVYAVIFSAGALYILRLMAQGPTYEAAPSPDRAPGSPLAAARQEPAP
jgi:cytochrome d ubiquinol oxidase subunit I